MTEDQKYQGALYKDKNKKQKTSNNTTQQEHQTAPMMPQQAYVEDVDEWRDYQGQTEDEKSPTDLPPEAPTPPAAVDDDNVNVFDFLVATGQTPTASNVNLILETEEKEVKPSESTELVRYEYNSEEYLDPTSLMDDSEPPTQYRAASFETPAPIKVERKKSPKTDKKRKHLHVEVPGDQVMTDAPPVLHSGLTGGLKGLMKLPPSPGDSGADANDPSPASPLKKTKHSKHSKHHGQISNSIFGILANSSKSSSKSKKRKTSKKSSSSSRHHREKSPKLIDYHSGSKNSKSKNEEGQMILFKPRAEQFFNFVNKGPDSERGCSMNKALKRFYRERQAAGTSMSKHMEEKELWRSLRLRRNEQGEIVLFSLEG